VKKSMRTAALTLLTITTAAAVATIAPPAANADAAGTVTFTLSGSALSISAPASTSLGSGAAGGTISAALGPVTVTDARALLVASWTASVSTTSFTSGTAPAAETIAASKVSYASGLATAQTGLSLVLLPGQLTTLLAAPMTSAVTAFSLTAGVGSNSATWNPTIIVSVPAAAVAGSYTGTITHSVA
jgi:hypothetical protein